MNKRERVFACMNQLPIDRPPAGLFKELTNGKNAVDAHITYQRQTDVDLMKIQLNDFWGISRK